MNNTNRISTIVEMYGNGSITLQEKNILINLVEVNDGNVFKRSPKLYPVKAVSVKEQGNSYFKQKNYKKALDYYEIALLIDPGNIDIWSNKKLVLNKLGLPEVALECDNLIKKIQTNPSIIEDIKVPKNSARSNPSSSSKVICKYCGSQLLTNNSKFCNNCGKNLIESPVIEPETNCRPQNPAPRPQVIENTSIKKVFDF